MKPSLDGALAEMDEEEAVEQVLAVIRGLPPGAPHVAARRPV